MGMIMNAHANHSSQYVSAAKPKIVIVNNTMIITPFIIDLIVAFIFSKF